MQADQAGILQSPLLVLFGRSLSVIALKDMIPETQGSIYGIDPCMQYDSMLLVS